MVGLLHKCATIQVTQSELLKLVKGIFKITTVQRGEQNYKDFANFEQHVPLVPGERSCGCCCWPGRSCWSCRLWILLEHSRPRWYYNKNRDRLFRLYAGSRLCSKQGQYNYSHSYRFLQDFITVVLQSLSTITRRLEVSFERYCCRCTSLEIIFTPFLSTSTLF